MAQKPPAFSVLVVEDNHRQRTHLVDQLKRMNVSALVATNAHEAIQVAALERPEVVLLDGLLPGMHGFEVARFLRHMDSTYQPFIVINTAIYKSIRYRNDARLKYGVDMYVEKPLGEQKLAHIFEAAAKSQLKATA
jgi:CheY-like chemotaxis protein